VLVAVVPAPLLDGVPSGASVTFGATVTLDGGAVTVVAGAVTVVVV
jgi:hypothetical protein